MGWLKTIATGKTDGQRAAEASELEKLQHEYLHTIEPLDGFTIAESVLLRALASAPAHEYAGLTWTLQRWGLDDLVGTFRSLEARGLVAEKVVANGGWHVGSTFWFLTPTGAVLMQPFASSDRPSSKLRKR